jgi:hypothetical protein
VSGDDAERAPSRATIEPVSLEEIERRASASRLAVRTLVRLALTTEARRSA